VSALSSHKVGCAAQGSQYASTDIDRGASLSLDGAASDRASMGDTSAPSMQDAKGLLAELQRSEGLSAGGAAKLEAEFAALHGVLAAARAHAARKGEHVRQLLEERRQLQTEIVADLQQREPAGVRATTRFEHSGPSIR
jgi:hypothetical protein